MTSQPLDDVAISSAPYLGSHPFIQHPRSTGACPQALSQARYSTLSASVFPPRMAYIASLALDSNTRRSIGGYIQVNVVSRAAQGYEDHEYTSRGFFASSCLDGRDARHDELDGNHRHPHTYLHDDFGMHDISAESPFVATFVVYSYARSSTYFRSCSPKLLVIDHSRPIAPRRFESLSLLGFDIRLTTALNATE